MSSSPMSSSPVLRIEGLRKSFGTNTVLEGITLSVMKNEVVCLIGASGSGKSTLLRCVNLLEQVDAGSIYLDGALITGRGVDQNLVRKHIGIVFQSYNLFPHMTVERNVTLGPCKALGMTRAEAAEEARVLLERFGLAEKRNDYPDRLSGGQQQRVAIVRALAMKPRLLLLDEVTSALDPELVAEVLDVIRELAEGGMTMVIATHEMGFARETASRVCFLEDGQIVEEAPPAQLFSAPADERTQRFLRRITDARRLLCTRRRPSREVAPPRGPGASGRRCGRSCAPRWAARRCCSARR
jgi:polar amino acid transport system ATP-binding protein